MTCPYCHGTKQALLLEGMKDIEYHGPGTFNVVGCEECGFRYLDPLPPSFRQVSRYPANYYTQSARRESGLLSYFLSIRYFLRWRRLRRWVSPQAKSILEIGCGDGEFLDYLSRRVSNDVNLTGVDAYLSSRKRTARVHWQTQSIDEAILPEGTDVIILYDTLEHLPEIAKTLRRLERTLSPNGVLVGTIPVWDTFWHRLFPKHWHGLSVPRHLSFFEKKNLERVLGDAGFTLVDTSPTLDPGDFSVTLANYICDRFNIKTPPRHTWFFLPLTLLAAFIEGLRLMAKKSGQMEFVARRT